MEMFDMVVGTALAIAGLIMMYKALKIVRV
jgi:hypothetical protein